MTVISIDKYYMKKCYRCEETKPLDLFYLGGKNKDVYSSYCKVCSKKAAKEWRNNNLAQHRKLCKKWESENITKLRENNLKWQKTHRAAVNKIASKYRAAKKRAIPSWGNTEFERFAVEEIYNLATLRSKVTGVKFQVDHIVPLQSDVVQGLHCISNLQILESSANKAKGNRKWPNMPGK